jgi:hypothetical protein
MEGLMRVLSLAVFGLFVSPALASEPASAEATVKSALSSLDQGAVDQAVNELEALSDRGVSHPDASYARARVYVERARSRSARPGDLGRAVAALEEYTRARPGDSVAERAVEALRSEIARRRARSGSTPMDQGPSLGRAVVGLAPENVWALIAAAGASLLTLGLGAKRLFSRRSVEIAGAVAIVVGLVLGSLGSLLTWAAARYRRTSEPAVVVVPEARLLDAEGRPLPARGGAANTVPEGALVHVLGRQNGKLEIEWGSVRGSVEAGQIRVLSFR